MNKMNLGKKLIERGRLTFKNGIQSIYASNKIDELFSFQSMCMGYEKRINGQIYSL